MKTNMVRLRLLRSGAKKRPYYRIIAIDQRKKRDGRALEFLGTYDPKSDPPSVTVNLEGIDRWMALGAQMAPTVKTLVATARTKASA
jgi:small subunit ribosomal protein S16